MTAGRTRDQDPLLRVLDLESGREVAAFPGPEAIFIAGGRVAFAPDGDRVAAGWSDGGLQVESLESQSGIMRPDEERRSEVLSLAWSPDDDRVAVVIECQLRRGVPGDRVERGRSLAQIREIGVGHRRILCCTIPASGDFYPGRARLRRRSVL